MLMGIGEAGYYAGVIYYLSFWYKRYASLRTEISPLELKISRNELAMRIWYVILTKAFFS